MLLRPAMIAVLMLATGLGSHGADAQSGKQKLAAGKDQRKSAELLRAARTWGYQLQNVSVTRLDRTPFDVLVVDAGLFAGDAGLRRDEVKSLKSKPDGTRRLVLAYVNVGEAEDYRYYWQKAWEVAPPAWMGSENCRWKGDHRVRHWSPEWQSIIYGSPRSYIGRLIDAGYDGAWLDRVDIFYYWRRERWQAADDMVRLVTALSTWAKALNSEFLIVPQNGEELISDPRYRAAIDGLGKEDMLFGDRGNDVRNSGARIERARRNLLPATSSGLPVLAIEYASKPESRNAAQIELSALGFKPYLGPRSLAYIGQDGPAHKEDGDTEPTIADQGDDSCG